jgi:hypothetical protein
MLNRTSPTWLLGGWLATVAVVVAVSMALGARLTTSGLLLMIGIAAAAVMVLINAGSAQKPTVAEILYSVDTNDRR